jgi:hypothetical protein
MKGEEMKPCKYCGSLLKADVHEAEMGMCLDCSNAYFDHDHEGCSWGCMAEFEASLGRCGK